MQQTKVKLPTGTQIRGVNCPTTGRPLYYAPGSKGIRVGRIGTTGSRVWDEDEVKYALARLDKSARRLLRKALSRLGRTDLAAFDVRGN